MLPEVDMDYEVLKNQGTGSHSLTEDSITETCPFGRYLVTVRLTGDRRFIGIEEIKVNKDFLSHLQKLTVLRSTGYNDVEKYYKDDDEE